MSTQKKGFTLVELLVVIAIIGILVALLLPAIQAAREAGRRTQCVNKIKQIGLAMQNHHDIRKHLPWGARSVVPPGATAHADAAQSGDVWIRYILPFLEENNLYDNWQDDKQYADGTVKTGTTMSNNLIIRTNIDGYQCPSDSPTSTWNAPTPNYNYAVNLGNTDTSRQGTTATPFNSVVFGRAPFEYHGNAGKAYRLADITDGTSKTLVVGEVRQGQVGTDLRGLIWYAPHVGFTTFYSPNTASPDALNGGFCNDAGNKPLGLPCVAASATAGTPTLFAARSRHPGGVNVGLADASSNFITNEIDITVWRNLSTMQDGAPVSVP